MSQATHLTPQVSSALPGAAIVSRIRRLVITALLSAVGYGAMMTASKGHCPGGLPADGDFLDTNGNVTETAPSCINLVLQPSVLIFGAIAVMVLVALTLVLRRATDEVAAIKYLDRAAAAVAILAVVSIVISHVWFGLIPITEWDGSGAFFFPFPFGSVDLTITPMTNS